MASRDNFVLCGAVMGVYGVRGWVRVRSDTKPRPALADYRPWRLLGPGMTQDCEPLEVREHGKGLVAQLAGVEDRDQAAALVGYDIAIPRSALPAPADDEYYWHDLIGLEVVATDKRRLGRVERLIETGAHDVLVIQGEDGEVLVPFVPHTTIVSVRLDEREIIVDWDWEQP